MAHYPTTNWPVDPSRPTKAQPELMNCLTFAADHRGYARKSELLQHYPGASDCGAFAYNPEDDYNDPVVWAMRTMLATPTPKATVLICGSAHGVCMQANRFRGIRAINADGPASAKIGRQHNDANVLCLSADNLSIAQMIEIIDIFLKTPALTDEKYTRRNAKLDQDFEPHVTQSTAAADNSSVAPTSDQEVS